MDISHLRLKARDLAHERLGLENRLLAHERFVKGCLVRLRTRCGQPDCRCRQSRKHRHGPYLYLSVSARGKTRMIHVPQAWTGKTEGWVKSAQSYRAARKEWIAIQKDLWKIFMQMERLKAQALPYGPEKKAGR
jgi:hypothetical protein